MRALAQLGHPGPLHRDHCFHTGSKGPSLKHDARMGFFYSCCGCFGNRTLNLSTPFVVNVQKPFSASAAAPS